MTRMTTVERQLIRAHDAASHATSLSHASRQRALRAIARGLRAKTGIILSANLRDLESYTTDDPRHDRLLLTEKRIRAMATDLETLATLPDPIGFTYDRRKRYGLVIEKKRIPLGVVGVVYEARPNVTVDVAGI